MSVLLACIYVRHVFAWCLWGSEEGVGFPGTGVMLVSHHVDAGNGTEVLLKSNQGSEPLSPCSSPTKSF